MRGSVICPIRCGWRWRHQEHKGNLLCTRAYVHVRAESGIWMRCEAGVYASYWQVSNASSISDMRCESPRGPPGHLPSCPSHAQGRLPHIVLCADTVSPLLPSNLSLSLTLPILQLLSVSQIHASLRNGSPAIPGLGFPQSGHVQKGLQKCIDLEQDQI